MVFEENKGFRTSSLTNIDKAARALAWFSIALGAAELVAPGIVGRAMGLENKNGLLRAFGAREIASGFAALQPNPAPGIWSRVGGDVADAGTLILGLKDGDPNQRRNATRALTAVAAITAIDVAVATALGNQMKRAEEELRDYGDRSGFPGGVAAARGAAARHLQRPDLRRETQPGYGSSPA